MSMAWLPPGAPLLSRHRTVGCSLLRQMCHKVRYSANMLNGDQGLALNKNAARSGHRPMTYVGKRAPNTLTSCNKIGAPYCLKIDRQQSVPIAFGRPQTCTPETFWAAMDLRGYGAAPAGRRAARQVRKSQQTCPPASVTDSGTAMNALRIYRRDPSSLDSDRTLHRADDDHRRERPVVPLPRSTVTRKIAALSLEPCELTASMTTRTAPGDQAKTDWQSGWTCSVHQLRDAQ